MLFRGQTLGKYRIVDALGSGGFGTVYLAVDTWIDKRVALKVPHRQNLDFDELLREPRLLAALDHPNIVGVITAERQNDVFFIVMEYVAGTSLEQVIFSEGALALGRALDYACQLTNAVEYAHRHGVLHRDLRPANVLVTDRDVVKVGDFGTSRFLEIAAHGTTVIGSPAYMSPEQFEGRAVFASDLYSIGVTLFQMLTGDLPYETPAPSDLARLRSGELLSSPRVKNPTIPKRLADVVMKAMAPSLTERYANASELLDALVTCGIAFRRHRDDGGGDSSPRPQAVDVERRDVRERIRARETPTPTASRHCWHCRKPLHARAQTCPFCGEAQER